MLLKMSDTAEASDLELLTRYTRDRSEQAFAELVRRHVNLVHSAALRQVCSPQLAEEIAQSAFTDLARNAHRLAPDTIVTAWLYQVTRRTAIDVVRRETRRQLREQIATEMNAMNTTHEEWTHIEPLLDEAMSALDDTDRAAVLLRYFENKSLREVGATLGTSDDAAQKRVSRAVERLREFFNKRGVTVGASGLVVVISANAVQAAPIGLALTISTAAALAGPTIATTATITKAIAMTTFQKTIVTATIAALAGAGIYEARQNSQLREQVKTLQQHQAPLAELNEDLLKEHDDMTNRLAALAEEIARSKTNNLELLRLRGEVGLLRRESQNPTTSNPKQPIANKQETRSEQVFEKGFGSLGEFLPTDGASDAGNSTPEAVLQSFVWAIRAGKFDEIAGMFSGQRKSGDVAGQVSESQSPFYQRMQNVFTNTAGFHLSSKLIRDGQNYRVRLDADPMNDENGEKKKNLHLSFDLQKRPEGWSLGNNFETNLQFVDNR